MCSSPVDVMQELPIFVANLGERNFIKRIKAPRGSFGNRDNVFQKECVD